MKKIKYQSSVQQPHSRTSSLLTNSHIYMYRLLKLGSASNSLLSINVFTFPHLLFNYFIYFLVSFPSARFPQTLRAVNENERAFFRRNVFIVITSEKNFLKDVLGVVFKNTLSSWSLPPPSPCLLGGWINGLAL